MSSTGFLNKICLYKCSNFFDSSLLFIFISLGKGSFLRCSNSQELSNVLQFLVFGYMRLYKLLFKIRGFGFKWKHNYLLSKYSSLYLKLGFTHRLVILPNHNSIYKCKKKIFKAKA